VPDLPALWREHQHATFPSSCLALSVDGVPLVKVDASVGAALTASLRTDGVPRPLSPERREDLLRGRSLAVRALAEAGLDAAGRAYIERLAALADAVLKG
jgi:hypothetical protein